ncbi:hypothetical protein JCM30197_07120 [Schleiferia thermophila]|nr:hypothetical protein JCM30197_07120 [Schleiferia thermophila]
MDKEMMKKIFWPTILLLLFLYPKYGHAFKGTVRNIYAQPISNALVEFVNESGEKFTTRTNAQGVFEINLKLFDTEAEKKGLYVFGNYPNPFYRETVIPFYLNREKKVTLYIADRSGRILFTAFRNKLYPKGINNYRLHTLMDNGAYLPPGMYLAVLTDGKVSHSTKLLVISSGTQSPNIRDIQDISLETLDPSVYQLTISAPGYKDYVNKRFIPADRDERFFVLHQHDSLPWKCVDHYLARHQSDGSYAPVFINGICLGISTPGTNPGELAASKEEYRRWLKLIWEAGYNSFRTYTIHYPRFYEVLDEFNAEHIERPLWLNQGIWLDDEFVTYNLYDKEQEYRNDIEEVIDAMHGNRTIPERPGRASGTYALDVTPWIMCWMLGREVEPYEIIGTDTLNPTKTSWDGEYVSIDSASPSEAWYAQMIDFAFKHEWETYGVQRPIGNSSWPTLDPLHHPTELPELSDEDIAQVDLTGLKLKKAYGGYFASYHAYPYYPNFISDDPGYQTFSDQYGPNSYLGYLTDLKNHYGNKPLLLGEYGVPTSWGTASYAHSGMHHGGHTEEKKAFYNIRMIQNIHQTHCAGGYVFAWMDEWFKTMWYTNPYGPTRDRRALWHNVVSAEENFGLLAFETDSPTFNRWPVLSNSCFEKLTYDYGQDFFYILVRLRQPLQGSDTLWFGIDTYDPELGESILPNGRILTGSRAEFALMITADTGKLYVTEAYNPFAINIYHIDPTFAPPQAKWHSTKTDGKPWEILRFTNGYRDFEVDTIGHFYVKKPDEPYINKHAIIWLDSLEFVVRIPWTYLLVADPSDHQVVHDYRETKQNERRKTDGFFITAFRNEQCGLPTPYRLLWPRWDKAWPYKERIKESYWIVKDANFTLDLKPF